MYPSYFPVDGTTEIGVAEMKIGPKQALLFSFSGKPRVKPTGFWSLSLYGHDQLFVENTLDQYALGDRSDLRYADGTPLKERDDGNFNILAQPADISPPSSWNNNWLPAPAGGGCISFTLRLFAPADEMLNGSYEYPKVTTIDAITS
ncbi:uncharacterized protein BP5553_06858 [Venustampulla echinocandica]|uniref:DUF1214 domain-containing protein n=1 Tax=Venustampulla echinocandica TaxID=2656787 RepID=A0A370TL40_9HELO|nr:uncharacterized protein BP5553_06858 [Venustampulla echinocandica]RDL36246.1 hypothetical protein BP5553_06858 [Venustampulla echinocandica]